MASSYIRIAGLPYPAEIGTPGKTAKLLGSIQLSRDGTPQDARRDEREEWTARLACDTLEGAEEAARILNGEVHSFGFNGSLESFGGVTPNAGSPIPARLAPLGGKHGGAVRVDAGSILIYTAQQPAEFTFLVTTRNDVADEPWRTFAYRSDGREWENGVENVVPAGVFNTVFSIFGLFALCGCDLTGGPLARFFDSALLVPWIVTPETLEVWTALDEPFSPFPELYMRGDAVAEPLGYTVTAESRSGEYLGAGGLAPGWTNNAVKQAFAVNESEQREEGLRFARPLISHTFDASETNPAAPEVRDVSGYARHGTLLGTTTSGVAPGRPVDGVADGEALLVPPGGAEGYTVPDEPALDITGDLTLAFWVKADSIAARNILVSKSTAFGVISYEAGIFGATGELYFRHGTSLISGDFIRGAPGVAVAGVFFHVVIVRRSGVDVVFYVNGGRDVRGRQAATAAAGSNASPLVVGGDPNGGFDSPGSVDAFGLWDAAATAEDALGIYLETARGAHYRRT